MTIKCSQCGNEKSIRIFLKDYTYKKKIKGTNKMIYFCSYECMRKAEHDNPDKFCQRRD